MCFVWPLVPVKIGQLSSNSASCLVSVSKKTQLRDGAGTPGGGFWFWLAADFAPFAGGVSPREDGPRLGSFLALGGMARSAWTKECRDEQLFVARLTVDQHGKSVPVVDLNKQRSQATCIDAHYHRHMMRTTNQPQLSRLLQHTAIFKRT